MNSSGRGNWFLMSLLLVVGMAVVVIATTPSWGTSSTINYTAAEGSVYYHNLSANISGFAYDVTFAIDTQSNISWTNSSGIFNVSADYISEWLSITNASSGNLTINALYDNQTGFFVIPIQATNTTGDPEAAVTTFEFIINATNDAPNFTSSGIRNNYTFTPGIFTNFTLVASDEENHFPLNYTIVFNDTCVHGAATNRNPNENCSLTDFGLNLTHQSNTSANITFTAAAADVGTYWANITVTDTATDYNCPHGFCDATYNTTNLSYSQMVMITVSPAITVNVSNCTGDGLILTQDEQFNCTIIITTPGQTDSLDLSSNATLKNPGYISRNSSLFYPATTVSAENFNYQVNISFTPGKTDVGNYTINFSTVDISSVVSNFTLIDLYINYTESNVTLDSIGDLNGTSALYENYTFELNATDDDLLIRDKSVKPEYLTLASNTTWVTFERETQLGDVNYTTFNISIDHTTALNAAPSGDKNVSVMINVSDVAGNSTSRIFMVEIKNETAPEWDSGLADPVVLGLTEGTLFTYNLSMNVTDSDSDPITFYFENVSADFCSLNASNFNATTGIINFTPTDCDVGYHNVTIIASDSFLNSSKQFNFTVLNIADAPNFTTGYPNINGGAEITNGSNSTIAEGTAVVFNLVVDDDDLLIPSGQELQFYNESLTVNVTATNTSDIVVDLFDFSFGEFNVLGSENNVLYNASFTPSNDQADNYTIVINVTDASGNSIYRTFFLNITSVNDVPNITAFDNLTKTIYDVAYLDVSDYASDAEGETITYALYNLTPGGDFLTINSSTGIINVTLNSTYIGKWQYNVTANDTATPNGVGYRVFNLTVYGNSTLVSPASQGIVYNFTENIANITNFTTNHTIGDNVTYEFWIDSITCTYQNSSNCTYGNYSLKETKNFLGNGTLNSWSFTPNFTDETYGNLKNLTVRVYPNTTALNSTQRAAIATNFTFKLNVSHTNAPITILANIPNPYPSANYGATPITINLGSYFTDPDYVDTYYLENITFNISTSAATTGITAESSLAGDSLPWIGFINDWSLQLYASTALTENITIVANDTNGPVSNGPFTVTFTAPSETVIPVPTSGGGGTKTKLKHFSLKLIVPQDVVISDQNYIDIPFVVQNNGQIDLQGINLGSYIRFNDEFSEDVRITLEDGYIETLKFGQSENFSMRIFANTQKSGRYKATILANVTSPKFSDFGEFFIELRKTNETEAEQILIFTEKFVAENPECLELTELINEAEIAFSLGEYSNSLRLATEATEACEDAISANEQIKFPITGFVKDNFYYISFSTLVIFLAGFIFYVYKRVRFNKYKVDNYV